jgi:hypothetical protein
VTLMCRNEYVESIKMEERPPELERPFKWTPTRPLPLPFSVIPTQGKV